MRVGDFIITKREMLVSVSLIAILLMIGVWISGGITEARLDADEVYNKAAKIEDAELFEYGMRTNAGNAFVYGDLKAVDTVTFPDINGEYMYVRKITEEYTRHTRTVTKTKTVNGETKTYTETEVYWTWDEVDRESKTCNEITFLGVTFNTNKIDIPGAGYITTVYESSRVRDVYYGTSTEHVGTIFTDLRDNTIKDRTPFYKNCTVNETVERLKAIDWTIGFWILWIFVIGGCVYGFYYIDNRWLE